MDKPQELRILAPESFREILSRRAIFKMGGIAAGFAIIAAACSGDDNGSSPASTEGSDSTMPPAGSALATGDWSRVINAASGTLAMYTWGDYNDPELVGAQAEVALGVVMKVDYYGSNEDLITKLAASGGSSSGFDIVVPTGPYIPQMIEKGLLAKFDKSLLPNMVNVDPLYLAQSWDPSNDYSVCKNWGTTGYFYDSSVITKELATWQDYLDVCMNEASGKCSVLDTGPNMVAVWLWANGYDWNTEDGAILDLAEAFLVDEFAQHIKAFDSYPSTKLAEGAYIISMAWNGDARQAYTRIAEAGGTPQNWKWVLGAPTTELWMDNYCIAAGSPNIEAAHAWINWLLIPEISIQDLQYHGYNSGMKNMSQLIDELAPDLEKGDMIFFTDEQVATMRTQMINTAIDRQIEIFDKMKAKAGS